MKTIGIISLLLTALPTVFGAEYLHFENSSPHPIAFSVEGVPAIRTVALAPHESVTLRLVGADPVIELKDGAGFSRSKDKVVVIDTNSQSLEPGMKSGDEGIARIKATITINASAERIVIRKEKNEK